MAEIKGFYGECFKTELGYVKVYKDDVYIKCQEAVKNLKKILESQSSTNEAYGVYMQAKKENISEWSSNKSIKNSIEKIQEDGEKFNKDIQALLNSYFKDWSQIKVNIKKLISSLDQMTQETIETTIPGDEILTKLKQHKQNYTNELNNIDTLIATYQSKISKLCEMYSLDTNNRYKDMKKKEKEIFKAKSNDHWWRSSHGDNVLVSPVNTNKWLFDDLSKVTDRLFANKR